MSSDISIVNATLAPASGTDGASTPRPPVDGDASFASVLDGQLERDPAAQLLLSQVPGKSGPSPFTDTDLIGSFPAQMSVRARFLPDPGLTRIEVGELALSNDDYTDIENAEWLLSDPAVALQSESQLLTVQAKEQSSAQTPTATDTRNAAMLTSLLPRAEAARQADLQTLNLSGPFIAHEPLSTGNQTLAAQLSAPSVNTPILPSVIEEPTGFMAVDEPVMKTNSLMGRSVLMDPDHQLLSDTTVPVQHSRTEISSSLGTVGIGAASSNGLSALPSVLTTATGGAHGFIMSEAVGSDAWQNQLSNRVTWLNGQTIKRAVIQLRPADLGPISVEVSVNDDKASVNFVAQHALTREALEAALPRLREMLADNGLDLSHAEVADGGGLAQDHGARDRSAGDFGPQTSASNVGEDASSDAESNGRITPLTDSQPSRTGLFDAFA